MLGARIEMNIKTTILMGLLFYIIYKGFMYMIGLLQKAEEYGVVSSDY